MNTKHATIVIYDRYYLKIFCNTCDRLGMLTMKNKTPTKKPLNVNFQEKYINFLELKYEKSHNNVQNIIYRNFQGIFYNFKNSYN